MRNFFQYIFCIAQIAPMSCLTCISHRPWQVWCTLHWSLHKLLPRWHQRANWRKPWRKEDSNLINICPTKPIQVLNIHGIFRIFCFCPLNDIFDINEIKSMLVVGPHGKDKKYSCDIANICNPNVNRGCPPLPANRTSADCVQITPGPSVQHIPLGIYHTGGLTEIQLNVLEPISMAWR